MNTHIIGIGNKLMGDEGVGVHAIEFLRTQTLPENIVLLDGGTGGMALFHILEDCERAILIDAADFGGKPGEVKRFELSDIKLTADSAQVSLHGLSLAGIIHLADKLDKKMPKISIIAIQPKTIRPSMELSEVCKRAVIRMVQCNLFSKYKSSPRYRQKDSHRNHCADDRRTAIT